MSAGPADAGAIIPSERRAFVHVFKTPPHAAAAAPGRVNLLGEHTDYNEGFVLPTPLAESTRVLAAPGENAVEAYAEQFDERRIRRPGDARDGSWMDYVAGCVAALADEGVRVPGARFYICRGVPPGAGLASSAALEVAVLRALRGLHGIRLGDLRLALVAHRAEVVHVGVRCGVMDQVVASLGQPGHALFLDTRSLAREYVCIAPGYRFTIIDTGVPRRLAEAGYNQRRAECEQAAARLGVRALRDLGLDDLPRIASLPAPLGSRARHVVTENARVLAGVEALRTADMSAFGRLMVESHRSLRDDYGVSTRELDHLVDLALGHGALGARLTGAGFGGCVLVLHPVAGADGCERRLLEVCPTARVVSRLGG